MRKIKIKTEYRKLLSDTLTPVSLYLKLRDRFPNSILLESSDYHARENSFSFICLLPFASMKVENGIFIEELPNGNRHQTPIETGIPLIQLMGHFMNRFEMEKGLLTIPNQGLFGYMGFDTLRYFEKISFHPPQNEDKKIPDLIYSFYQYIIVINHFNEEAYIVEHLPEGKDSQLEEMEFVIRNKTFSAYDFKKEGNEQSNYTDEEFLGLIKKGKEHCKRGDVFQIVFSREFSQDFSGDDFNVYRALRSVNPSPYLFYFDYGDFKIFGSSPEAQLTINDRKASIHPIAGTFKRTGNDIQDAQLAEQLRQDPKENAEHVMLVDLARNDLSKNCDYIQVEKFRETQFYSHVIHLVSHVQGQMNKDIQTLKVVADTFPAGTLTGAPKYKALQLIEKYEKNGRGFYGGCIGYLAFNGDFNHAIMIRSFLSKNNKLFFQAGAGIVNDSVEGNELAEVNNKLMALKKALQLAETL